VTVRDEVAGGPERLVWRAYLPAHFFQPRPISIAAIAIDGASGDPWVVACQSGSAKGELRAFKLDLSNTPSEGSGAPKHLATWPEASTPAARFPWELSDQRSDASVRKIQVISVDARLLISLVPQRISNFRLLWFTPKNTGWAEAKCSGG
jgi:hypothetical protein